MVSAAAVAAAVVTGKHKKQPSTGAASTKHAPVGANALNAASAAAGQPTSMASTIASQLEDDADQAEEGHWFCDHLAFKLTIGLAVLANTIQMGMEADRPEWSDTWFVFENIFTSLFFAEMVVKLGFLRFHGYFMDYWNWLDASLVMLSVVDTWILTLVGDVIAFDMQNLSILRIFRLFRLVRVLKLVKGVRRFVLVIRGVLDAIQATFWVSGVMMLAIYIAAIFCVGILGKPTGAYPGYSEDEAEIDATDLMMDFNPHLFFGSIGASMLTLFNVVILAEWSEIVRPIMIKQPYLVVFFVAFITFTTFGVMNVIIGMIVENVMSNARAFESDEAAEELKRKLQTLDQIQTMWGSLAQDHDGRVTADVLAECMLDKKSTMRQLLSQVDLPRGFSPSELMFMLDCNGDGGLNQNELIEGMYRLIDSGPFQSICLVQKGINELKVVLREVQQDFQKQIAESRAVTLASVEDCRKSVEARTSRVESLVASAASPALQPKMAPFPALPAASSQWLEASVSPGEQLRGAVSAAEDLAIHLRRGCAAEAPVIALSDEAAAQAGPPSYEAEAKFGGDAVPPQFAQPYRFQPGGRAEIPGVDARQKAQAFAGVGTGAGSGALASDRQL